jgi:hypothetical protein
LLILLLLLLWWFLRPGDSVALFSGTLHDASGQPVAGAEISVGDHSTVTDQEGRFVIKGSWVSRERWVLEARRRGFAPISKVFGQGSTDLNLTTVKTTTQAFNAASVIVARDIRTTCIGSVASGVDWGAHPLARFPQAFDASGNRVTGQLPPAAQRALQYVSGAQPCSSGFQVSIPANSLVNASGQAVQGQVEVGLSTVDLYSPDGMPGDYTVASDGAPAYMESFGAGTLEARSGDEILQLKKGTKAEIVIPVDRAQIEAGAKIPASIPLLRYEAKTGKWQNIGEATLDTGRMVYIGQVEHFSEYNADVVKTNPACVRFDASGIAGSFQLVTTECGAGQPQSPRRFQPARKPVGGPARNQGRHPGRHLGGRDWRVLGKHRSANL